MDARLSQIADAENELVRALAQALSRVDQRLLQDVRKITTEHGSGAALFCTSCRAWPPGSARFPSLASRRRASNLPSQCQDPSRLPTAYRGPMPSQLPTASLVPMAMWDRLAAATGVTPPATSRTNSTASLRKATLRQMPHKTVFGGAAVSSGPVLRRMLRARESTCAKLEQRDAPH